MGLPLAAGGELGLWATAAGSGWHRMSRQDGVAAALGRIWRLPGPVREESEPWGLRSGQLPQPRGTRGPSSSQQGASLWGLTHPGWSCGQQPRAQPWGHHQSPTRTDGPVPAVSRVGWGGRAQPPASSSGMEAPPGPPAALSLLPATGPGGSCPKAH